MPKQIETESSQAPLKPDAVDIFTDRFEEQKLLRTILQPVPTSELKDGTKAFLTQFYGVGGIGKSSLYERAIKIAHDEFSEKVRVVHTSFDVSHWNESTPFSEVAAELCRCLLRIDVVPELTISLLAVHGQETGRGREVIAETGLGWSTAVAALEKGADLSGIPYVGKLFKGAIWLRERLKKKSLGKRLAELALYPKEDQGKIDPADLESKLHRALFHDVVQWLREHPELHIRFVIDGFERLQGNERRKDSQMRLQELLGGFAGSTDRVACDRVRVIIFGRDKLRWDELYQDPGWNDCWNLHVLGGLAERDARKFLQKFRDWLSENEQHKLSDALRHHEDGILDAAEETKGEVRVFYPYYLDLAIETLSQALRAGAVPEFGRSPVELQDRFFKYLETKELRALQILALSEVFDERLFDWLAEKRLVEYAQHSFHTALRREHSYFRRVEGSETDWSFHRLMEDALHAKWRSSEDSRSEGISIVQRLMEYYGHKLIEKPEREWTEADLESWRRGMEILVTQGPELELLPIQSWRELLNARPWNVDHFKCLDQRIDFTERVLKAEESMLGPEHLDTMGSIKSLGKLLISIGDYVRAEVMLRRALEGFEKALGAEHPSTLASINNLGILLNNKGDYAGAEVMLRRALEGFEKALGAEHPSTLASINSLGSLLYSKGDNAGAEVLLRRALEGKEKSLGAEHPDTLRSVHNLGILLSNKGDYAGAEVLLRRALEGHEKSLGAEHPTTLASVNSLGDSLTKKGAYESAEVMLRRALDGREKAFGAEHPTTLASVNSLGVLLSDKGDNAGAEVLFQRAMEGKEKSLGAEHPDTLRSVHNLGNLLNEKDRRSEAIALLRSKAEMSDQICDGVRYKLACYECLEGNIDEAKQLISAHLQAHPEMKPQALADSDFTAIHDYIARMM